MKRVVPISLAMVILLSVAAAPAEASGRRHYHPRHHGGRVFIGAYFGPPVLFAPYRYYFPAPVYVAPPPVYAAPAPVYTAPPAPVCRDVWVEGHYEPMSQSEGAFTQHFSVWVPGQYQRSCNSY